MKRYLVLLIILAFASCQKNTAKTSADYILVDSNNFTISDTIALQIQVQNSIIYNGSAWAYNGGYYFNGLNYIYLYSANNDSIYIDYPDTALPILSKHFIGYKQN